MAAQPLPSISLNQSQHNGCSRVGTTQRKWKKVLGEDQNRLNPGVWCGEGSVYLPKGLAPWAQTRRTMPFGTFLNARLNLFGCMSMHWAVPVTTPFTALLASGAFSARILHFPSLLHFRANAVDETALKHS